MAGKGFWRWYDRASRVDFAGTLLALFLDWKPWLFGLASSAVTFIGTANQGWDPWAVWLAALAAGAFVAVIVIALRLHKSPKSLLPHSDSNAANAGQPSIKASSSLDGTLKLECVHEQFQFPADGKLLELIASDDAARSISFQSHWLSEYAYRTKPDIIPTRGGFIDRCRITNFGSAPVFNVKITVRAEFSNHVPVSPIMTAQHSVETKEYDFVVPQIDPGIGGTVDVYMWNYTKYSVSLTFPDEVELQKLGGTDRETVRLIPAYAAVALWPPQTLPKPDTLLLMLLPAAGQLNLHNNGKEDLNIWGTKFDGQPPAIEKEFRIVPAGNFYYLLTNKLEAEARQTIGADGQKLEPFEIYLADKSDKKFVAKFQLLIAMKAGAMTIHVQHLGVEARDW